MTGTCSGSACLTLQAAFSTIKRITNTTKKDTFISQIPPLRERKGKTMQFMITAYDGTDGDALARRMKVRPQHLENMSKVREMGHVICAGGLLDDDGKMKGSFLIMEFDSRKQLDDYLETEPYMKSNIWQDVRVETCNVVIRNPG